MLYIYLDTRSIKLMHLKKSLLGQYETSFHTKEFQLDLLQGGKPANPDVIASGMKETLSLLPDGQNHDKDVTLILPQESFSFFREDMPVDVTDTILTSYLIEKARTKLKGDLDTSSYDYLIQENEGKKKILFYAIQKETIKAFEQPLSLIELSLKKIVPESLTYFKLFDKTLRANKKETIWYVSYDQDQLSGYVFDSFGLLEDTRWTAPVTKEKNIEQLLEKQASTYTSQNIKLNRLILSGGQSDDVRQDTFTKNVGVWTNPLKRIIPHFYAEYVKLLSGQDNKEIPVLKYDMLLGAFIFLNENQDFSLMKESKKTGGITKPSFSLPTLSLPSVKLPFKGILFFVISFMVTFGILVAISQAKAGSISLNIPLLSTLGLAKPTPTPTPTPTPEPPTPTPTPAIERTAVKIKILNGSGIAGKASDVKEFLRSAGYEEILTANADSFDFTTTVVRSKEGADDIKNLVSEDISSQVSGTLEYETLDADAAADIEIIVGTDFK